MKKFFTSLFLACPSSFITHLRYNLKTSDLIACMKLNEKRYYLDKNSWSQLQATYGIKTQQEEETKHGINLSPVDYSL